MALFRVAHGYNIWRVRDFCRVGYVRDKKEAFRWCHELTNQTGDTYIVVPWKRIDGRTKKRKRAREG